ncbi:MAG: glycosyltransferase family 4 protein [Candidatus Dependentiae bacterium]|nr:glycosyltransferase family 4 protein [Candidatus Dependentiae bacterium]
MNIVHVEDFFHPEAGYQLNMLAPLQVKQGHTVTIITAELDKIPEYLKGFFGEDQINLKDNHFEKETGVKVIRVPLLIHYSGRAIFKFSIFKKIAAIKPDILFAHGIDSATGMLFSVFSKWLSYPVISDCHMVEIASKNKFNKYFRKFFSYFIAPIIIKNNIHIIRLFDDDYVERCLGVPLSQTTYHQYGTDTTFFKPCDLNRKLIRDELGLGHDEFVVVYAGKMDDAKGGLFFSNAILDKFETTNNKTISFLIIGNTNGEYEENVNSIFKKSANKISRIPTQKYRDLLKYYQAADIAIYPKQCSMSFFEAQSCGLPVIFENNNINISRSQFNNAITFEKESIVDFRAKILEMANLPDIELTNMRLSARKYIINYYDYSKISEDISNTIETALEKWNLTYLQKS